MRDKLLDINKIRSYKYIMIQCVKRYLSVISTYRKFITNYICDNSERILAHTHKQIFLSSYLPHPIYVKIHQRIANLQLKNIRDKLKKTNTINIGFYLYTASMWSCDQLYKLFRDDKRFNPIIYVCGVPGTNCDEEMCHYYGTIKYFEDKNYNVLGLYDIKGKSWDYIEKPDILFLLTPYSGLPPEQFSINNIPLDIITISIPYGIHTLYCDEKKSSYNRFGTLVSWKYFIDTRYYLNSYSQKSRTHGFNAIYSGYPKMDDLQGDINSKNNIKHWRTPTNTDCKKIHKIIYAPHYSIRDSGIKNSTFDQNYMYILEYARDHPKTTSWIYKPHPNLRNQSVKSGLFNSLEEYDAYENAWRELPNATVSSNETYTSLFTSSDGMILDSGSFLGEYQYTKKPLLYLRREGQTFNDLALEILKVQYSVPGDDLEGIKSFIEEVMGADNDYLKQDRELFFKDNMDYISENGKNASEFIYEYILSELAKED